MNFFANSTIKQKLMLIIMITCSAVLLLASAAILIYEITSFKDTLKRNTEVMAQVIGANSEAALRFKDKRSHMCFPRAFTQKGKCWRPIIGKAHHNNCHHRARRTGIRLKRTR